MMSEIFQPTLGRLGQLIFESPHEGIEPRLEFFLEIEFAEGEFDEEPGKPFFRANQILIPTRSWRDLEGTAHEFPWAPKPGSVGASVLLFGEQNPADVTALRFGEISEGKITVSFATEVDFEIEADRDELGQVELEFSELLLEIGPLKIATSLEKRHHGDPEEIAAAIAGIIDLNAYGPVTKVPGGFALEIAG